MSGAAAERSAEAAGEALQLQIDWSDGFWLGWLFIELGADEAALRARAAAALHEKGIALRDLVIDDAASLRSALHSFAEESPRLSWLRLRAPGEEGARLWTELHLRLNERRELLRRTSPGGVVLVAPLAHKVAARNAAPDLWSARSLVFEVDPRPAAAPRAAPAGPPPPAPERALLPPLRAHEAGLFTAGGGRAPALKGLLDSALRALDAGRADEAYALAEAALRDASAPADAALAALRAAEARTAQGRGSEALPLLERSAHQAREASAPTLAWAALIRLADLQARAGALPAAAAAAAEARSWAARAPDPADAQRRGAIAAQQQGQIAAQQGDLDAAAAHLGAAVREAEAYLARVGPAPGALGPLSSALTALSGVERGRGALDAAVVAAQEAVARAREGRRPGADHPGRAAAELDGLVALCRAQLARGALAAARAAADEAVALAAHADEAERATALGVALWCVAEAQQAGPG